jgi:hypothetical protein
MAYEDYYPLLNNPWLNFGMGMLGASAPSNDPRSASLAWAMSQGLGAMQHGLQNQAELDQREVYVQRVREEMKEAEAERKRQQKAREAMAKAFTPQSTVTGQMDIPGLPPGGAKLDVMVPPTAEQHQQNVYAQIQQMMQTDPETGMALWQYLQKSGIPGQSPPPDRQQQPWWTPFVPKERLPELAGGVAEQAAFGRAATTPWYMEGVAPGSSEWTRAQEIARGTRPRASVRGTGGEASESEGPLNKKQWDERLSISRARASIAKLNADRATAEQMAKTDKGFAATLELANRRMPGDDPAWEKTMARRATRTAKGEAPSAAQIASWQQQYAATKDPMMKQRLREKLTKAGFPPK